MSGCTRDCICLDMLHNQEVEVFVQIRAIRGKNDCPSALFQIGLFKNIPCRKEIM